MVDYEFVNLLSLAGAMLGIALILSGNAMVGGIIMVASIIVMDITLW